MYEQQPKLLLIKANAVCGISIQLCTYLYFEHRNIMMKIECLLGFYLSIMIYIAIGSAQVN